MLAPVYLADDSGLVSSVASRRHLRFAGSPNKNGTGTRDLAVSSAVVWNFLPAELQVASLTVTTFARHLKACLFSYLDQPIWWLIYLFIWTARQHGP